MKKMMRNGRKAMEGKGELLRCNLKS